MRTIIENDEIFLPEPVGKQPKYWLLSYNERYLFKIATLKADGTPIYNDVSECIASDIAKLIKIPVAEYYLCQKGDQKGVLTKDFLDNDIEKPKREELFDGVYLISQVDQGFKNKSLENPQTKQYYTIELILKSLEAYNIKKEALNMIIFDCLIANRDRNPSNYGIIVNHETKKTRFAPLYDSCASLGISMVSHRLRDCFNERGMIINDSHLNVVIHKHIVGKVTLDRSLLYKDKRAWDNEEEKNILTQIERKKRELIPLVNSGEITLQEYHKILNGIGNKYRKFDITKPQYQTIISYLTNYYSEEIEEIIGNIKEYITEENIDKILDYYKDEITIDRLNMAREIILRRANWIVSFYEEKKYESRGKLL